MAKDGAWYAVTSLRAGGSGGFQGSLWGPVSTGADPVEVVKRHRASLERELNSVVPGSVFANSRPGSMYGVWRFEEKVPLTQAARTMWKTLPWRVFVLTSSHGWQYMAELCPPPDTYLYMSAPDSLKEKES
jgi:hypothetical protein